MRSADTGTTAAWVALTVSAEPRDRTLRAREGDDVPHPLTVPSQATFSAQGGRNCFLRVGLALMPSASRVPVPRNQPGTAHRSQEKTDSTIFSTCPVQNAELQIRPRLKSHVVSGGRVSNETAGRSHSPGLEEKHITTRKVEEKGQFIATMRCQQTMDACDRKAPCFRSRDPWGQQLGMVSTEETSKR